MPSPPRSLRRAKDRAELVGRLAETWIRRPATPTRVVMSITRRCNLRCNMCHVWKMEEAAPPLTPDEVRDVFGRLPRLTWLDITGGEVFIRPDAEAVFDAVLESAPALRMLHFPTNGWFGDRAVALCEQVRDHWPSVDLIVTVSIDGPREVHDTIRGREGSFDRALATLRRLRSIDGVSAYVGTTVTTANDGHLDALEATLHRELAGFRADEWHWNWMQVSEHFFGNAKIDGPRAVDPAGMVQRHVRRRGLPRGPVALMELGFLVNLEHYLRGEPTGVGCQSLRSTCFISPEGDLYPCHVWDRPLGNVREQPIDELWHSAGVRAARKEVQRLDCGGCFTPCEAYPALAGSPVRASLVTAKRLAGLARARRSQP